MRDWTRDRRGAATVMAVALVCLLLVLVASVQGASHGDGGHGNAPWVLLLPPVFLFGLLAFEASLLPPGCWSKARLPAEPVRHSLRQRPPPLG